ncbi:guanine-1-methyltransferase-domain-containing protein, partial [Jimgerdemannia flammicorona]
RQYKKTKLERRRAEKERIKRKKAEFREKIDKGLIAPSPKKQRIEQNPTNLRIVIDCSFNNLMTQKEINSMAKQIICCYSANKVSPHLIGEICIMSHGGQIKDGVMWNTNLYEETFDKEELVYLMADSNDRILEIDEGKVYIIGGIMDKNRHKKLCYEKASKQGIRTMQLPIGEYIKMASWKVLTVNHVFEILLKYMEHKDWEKAFLEIIPHR